jgi:alpha-D-xyloside xylohydrolase
MALEPAKGKGAEPGKSAAAKELTGEWQPHLPGIWKARLGTPERATPVSLRTIGPATDALKAMAAAGETPLGAIHGSATPRGFELSLPLAAGELMYGFGLQMYSVMQRGTKKTLRVNADPKGDSGDAHAPVPFYVTTRGYGVLVDTARYAAFYCGSTHPHGEDAPAASAASPLAGFAVESSVHVEIPEAQGVDVYLFGGPAMVQAIARYNLFSGGGVNPPEWGLGFWYRAYLNADADRVLELAREFRERKIPCDVMGLEPGWQTHAYSCSFVWEKNRFPDPAAMIASLSGMNYKLNLWEHAYTHPTAPIYKALEPYAGDYDVFGGLVPDLSLPAARRVFGDYQKKACIDLGVSGFKLDECDNSDFTGGWAFPEFSHFPSGLDGEQMHSIFGLRYQDTILEAYERAGRPTYGLVRSSGALAAPYPFVLYSDLYDHRVFIRALINSGFSGLLFCPEVRDAQNAEDLIRRMQSVVFSPVAMVNAWYEQNPPWKQLHAPFEAMKEREKSAVPLDADWEKLEAQCREVINLRMQLAPYFRAAFDRYAAQGTPPFRALIVDWPDDERLALVDDAYLVGDRMLVAPVFAGETSRDVVLPRGNWCDFWTGEELAGGRTIKVQTQLDRIPVYVKAGSVLPMAEVGPHTSALEARRLTVRVYGDGSLPFGLTHKGAKLLTILWNNATGKGEFQLDAKGRDSYEVIGWKKMTE